MPHPFAFFLAKGWESANPNVRNHTVRDLGVLLAQLNQMAGAKEHLQRAIGLGDNDREVKENLAKVLQSLDAAK